jgi:hypothetical protein
MSTERPSTAIAGNERAAVEGKEANFDTKLDKQRTFGSAWGSAHMICKGYLLDQIYEVDHIYLVILQM